jgi:hypothetical protein
VSVLRNLISENLNNPVESNFFCTTYMSQRHMCLLSKTSKVFSSPLNFVSDKFGVYDRVPQDTVLNPGKLRTLKWIPG